MEPLKCEIDANSHSETFLKHKTSGKVRCYKHLVLDPDEWIVGDWQAICFTCGDEVIVVHRGFSEARNRPCGHLAYYIE